MPKTITIIGAGNMGASLALGLLRAGHPPEKLKIADPSTEKLAPFTAANVVTTHNNDDAIKDASVVILAIKPLILPKVLQPLVEKLCDTKPLIISIAAGVSLKILNALLLKQCVTVRAMPNLPATLGCGATALFSYHQLPATEKLEVENIFNAVGSILWLTKEAEMDAVTAVSGSGPAYFFFLLEAMEKAAIQLGLSSLDSKKLILQTAVGAIQMASLDSKNFAELRQAVTSKGGTTESALQVLNHANVATTIIDAIKAAEARSQALSKKLEQDLGV